MCGESDVYSVALLLACIMLVGDGLVDHGWSAFRRLWTDGADRMVKMRLAGTGTSDDRDWEFWACIASSHALPCLAYDGKPPPPVEIDRKPSVASAVPPGMWMSGIPNETEVS
ncbi:hypothetical protein CC79DRAFT_1330097 [Sarocladium strictum]